MNIITVTVNPALDKSAKVDGVKPGHKLKCHSIKYQPGGGGINISRVLKRLGIVSRCIYTEGGDQGEYLSELVLMEEIQTIIIPTRAWTRENLSVLDTTSSMQYRFGMPGNGLMKKELRHIHNIINMQISDDDILVLSGSLPPDTPTDYYLKLIRSIK